MILTGFVNNTSKKEYDNKNRFNLPLPRGCRSYKELAARIEKLAVTINSKKCRNIEGYRELLCLAFRAFGPGLYGLRHIGNSGSGTGEFTKRFLTETYELVKNGKPREINIHSWLPLLDGPDVEVPIITYSETDEQITKHTLVLNRMGNYKNATPVNERSTKPLDYLCNWLCQPQGVMDMMLTLQYCYGKHSLVEMTDVRLPS